MKTDTALNLVAAELVRATKKFGSFSSTHEGYAVILEELDELWDEVKTNPKSPDRIREEAVQVAAMGIRFLIDCCEEPSSTKDDVPTSIDYVTKRIGDHVRDTPAPDFSTVHAHGDVMEGGVCVGRAPDVTQWAGWDAENLTYCQSGEAYVCDVCSHGVEEDVAEWHWLSNRPSCTNGCAWTPCTAVVGCEDTYWCESGNAR